MLLLALSVDLPRAPDPAVLSRACQPPRQSLGELSGGHSSCHLRSAVSGSPALAPFLATRQWRCGPFIPEPWLACSDGHAGPSSRTCGWEAGISQTPMTHQTPTGHAGGA